MVGKRFSIAAFPDPANLAHSAFSQILDKRYFVRVADNFRSRQSGSRRRCRVARLGIESFFVIQIQK
jgi:hypothetical protein